MKGFIVVSDRIDNEKCCIPISSIVEVAEVEGGVAYITYQFYVERKGRGIKRLGFRTAESFEEVIKKIKEAIE